MKAQPLIQIQQLSFAYDRFPVLEAVNLTVTAGEFLGIVGPNAGGKSTLLKLILGLLQPQSGSISVFGQSPRAVRWRIGYVPQYPGFPRDFPISVEQLVLQGRLGSRGRWWASLQPGGYSASDYQAARQALEEVEAWDLASRTIDQLSGGQLQRVLLARALVSEPELLILDEPTANLDLRLESDIFDRLKQLNERLTILVVSHDIAFISSYVSRVACINRTLICHRTEALDGRTIQALYGAPVRQVVHRHG